MAGTIKFNYTFNDGAGTTLSDVSLYNRDAILTTDGSGVWTTDIPFDESSNAALVHPNSFYFKGGDYFEADVSDNWSGSFTFSIWVKPTEDMVLYDKTWGDEATLLAISVLFKIEIIVISSLPGNYAHSIKPPLFWKVDLQNKIYLGHYHEFHYVSTSLI